MEHFPKGIGKSPVSVFTEILQSRLYKEAKAILWGNMMFLESCATRLNTFATSNFCESLRDVLRIFAHWKKLYNISHISYSVDHSEFAFTNLVNQYPITVFYIHYSLNFCEIDCFKEKEEIGECEKCRMFVFWQEECLGREFWKFRDPVISLWPGFHPLFLVCFFLQSKICKCPGY